MPSRMISSRDPHCHYLHKDPSSREALRSHSQVLGVGMCSNLLGAQFDPVWGHLEATDWDWYSHKQVSPGPQLY